MVLLVPRAASLPAILLVSSTSTTLVSAFGILPVDHHHPAAAAFAFIDSLPPLDQLASSISIQHHHALLHDPSLPQLPWGGSSSLLSSAASNANPLDAYRQQLAAHPVPTKMLTGATVALIGDALAQSRDNAIPYDRRRAASFMAFDASYRWLQHTVYPPMVAHLTGTTIGGIAALFFDINQNSLGSDATKYFAVAEQTLCSQLVIVPLLYYPVFYTVTGLLQQLTFDETVQRAKETFVPLMKRNLLFWIPVQFVQFGFVEENLQVPFLAVCGLVWTIILSVMAGAVRTNDKATEESVEMAEHYCVTGAEESCEIDPDDLFPHVFDHVFDEGGWDDDDDGGVGGVTMEKVPRAGVKMKVARKQEDGGGENYGGRRTNNTAVEEEEFVMKQ